MRPIKLMMTAFGTYRDKETIDFSRLEDRRLFVISGNTGAGKTTIFDAICYALYGAASGEDRSETRMLRSHFADDETHTAVDFTFAVGKRTFRIFRQMAHRKGSNKNETGDKVELYETTSCQEVPIAERFLKKEVNDKVEAILGLTKEQFSQIVMLPQGEFRKLLTSDTENKEEILRHIFRTELYQRLEERFGQKSRELRDAHKDAYSRLDIQMKQVQESLPPREESALWNTFQQEHYNPAQIMDGLGQEMVFYRQLALNVEERKTKVSGQLVQKETELRTALVVNGRFGELRAKRDKRTEMEQEKAAKAEQGNRLALAEKAARIEPYEENADKATRDVENKRQMVEAKRQDVENVRRGLMDAEELYRREEARESERKEAERELQRLTEMVPVVQTLDSQKNELEHLQTEEKECSLKLADAEMQIAVNREGKQMCSARIKELETETVVLPDKLESLERLRNQQKLLQELVKLEKQIGDLALLEAKREQTLVQIKTEHDRLEHLWIEGQASLLAKHLHNGEPCPVCGSSEHPNKAAAGDDLPSREELQKAKEELQYVQLELSETRGQVAAARSSWERDSQELVEYGIEPEGLTEQYARVESEERRLKAETDELKQKVRELQNVREQSEKLDQAHNELLTNKEQFVHIKQNLAVDIGKKQSVLEKELERIPESLRSPELLDNRMIVQSQLVDQLAEAWKAAQQQLQLMTTRLAEEKANADQLGKQFAEAEVDYKETTARFQQELGKAGFPSTVFYLEAKLPEQVRQAYKEELETFRQMLATLNNRLQNSRRSWRTSSRLILMCCAKVSLI
jgi:exonuclease SbcC